MFASQCSYNLPGNQIKLNVPKITHEHILGWGCHVPLLKYYKNATREEEEGVLAWMRIKNVNITRNILSS